MPRHLLTTVSEAVSVDASNNSLSIFLMVNQITAPSFPFVFPALTITTIWQSEAGDESRVFTQRHRIVKPDNNQVFSIDTVFKFLLPQHRVFSRVLMVPFENHGTYDFEVYISDGAEFVRTATYPITASATV